LLNSLVGGAAMALSRIFVVSNSLWLRTFGRVTGGPSGAAATHKIDTPRVALLAPAR
jgi:hypothetical protein